MTKTIILTDYANTKREVEIPNIENVLFIHITIQTGDEILTVRYTDDTPTLRVDTGDFNGGRIMNFKDGEYDITVSDIDMFNQISARTPDRGSYETLSSTKHYYFIQEGNINE